MYKEDLDFFIYLFIKEDSIFVQSLMICVHDACSMICAYDLLYTRKKIKNKLICTERLLQKGLYISLIYRAYIQHVCTACYIVHSMCIVCACARVRVCACMYVYAYVHMNHM